METSNIHVFDFLGIIQKLHDPLILSAYCGGTFFLSCFRRRRLIPLCLTVMIMQRCVYLKRLRRGNCGYFPHTEAEPREGSKKLLGQCRFSVDRREGQLGCSRRSDALDPDVVRFFQGLDDCTQFDIRSHKAGAGNFAGMAYDDGPKDPAGHYLSPQGFACGGFGFGTIERARRDRRLHVGDARQGETAVEDNISLAPRPKLPVYAGNFFLTQGRHVQP